MRTHSRSLLAASLALALIHCTDDLSPDAMEPRAAQDQIAFTLDGSDRTIARIANGQEPPLPEGSERRSVSIDGEEIFALEIPGDGPAIVLMHGLPDNTTLYERLYPELQARGRRVIAFDFVGWGRSSRPLPGGDYPYTFDQQKRELAAVVDALLGDGEAFVLVVHDSSGPSGIDYARENPERVERLVLLNTFYGQARGALLPPKGVELHSDPRLEQAELTVQSDASAIESFYRFQMDEFIVSAPREQEFIGRLWALWAEARPAFVAITNRLPLEVGSRSMDENERLAQLAMPVSIVFGEDDPYLNPRVAQHFAEHIPDAQLVLIEDSGHFVQVDTPGPVADAIAP